MKNKLGVFGLLVIAFGSIVWACGGSGSAPTADAGELQDVNVNTDVTLDGSGSSDPAGGALTYSWTQSSGPTATLSDATAEQPTFTTGDTPATYVFSLVVNNGSRDSDPSTVSIRVWEDLDNRVFVDASASASISASKAGDGSLTSPFTTIAEAIAAGAGSAYVAAGTYVANLTMVEGVSLYGGYESSNWTRDISTNTTTISPTTSDPTVTFDTGLTNATFLDGFSITGPTSSAAGVNTVLVENGGSARISQNTIAGGTTTVGPSFGVSCEDNAQGVLVSDNTITMGTGDNAQGTFAVSFANCAGTISGNTMTGSSSAAYSVGGVGGIALANGADVTVTENTIDAGMNQVTQDTVPGTMGMYIINSSGSTTVQATITRNHIDAGDAVSTLPTVSTFGSAGIFAISTSSAVTLTIENNVIYGGNGYATAGGAIGDSAAISLWGQGGGVVADVINNTIYVGQDTVHNGSKIGVYTDTPGEVNVVNNALVQNDSANGDLFCVQSVLDVPSIAITRLWNNDFDVAAGENFLTSILAGVPTNYTTLVGVNGLAYASDNISGDPMFEAGSDYLLSSDSPLIDAGYSGDAVTLPTVDYDGNARPSGSAYDIGASEFQQ